MRDVMTIPFQGDDLLIIASDNSGGIGMKDQDLVHVPYETVAYYSFRVAVMECIAAGGQPVSVVLHNFCGNDTWSALVKGISIGLAELRMSEVPITGSTESNFSLQQSAVGLLVLGKKSLAKKTEIRFSERLKFAVIGMPLVGNEVVEQHDEIAPLAIFQEVSKVKDVILWPVGSKGILYELNQMFPKKTFTTDMVSTNIDVIKSSGPSTCFIIVHEPDVEDELKHLTKGYFHTIKINN